MIMPSSLFRNLGDFTVPSESNSCLHGGWISLHLLSANTLHLIPIMVPWKERLGLLRTLVKQGQYTPPQGLLKGLNELRSENGWHIVATNQFTRGSFTPARTPLFSHTIGFALFKHTHNFNPSVFCSCFSHCFMCVFPISRLSLLKVNEYFKTYLELQLLSETFLTPPGDLILFYISM